MSMYTTKKFKTKKALKEAVANGERVTLYAPGLGKPEENGFEYVAGPGEPEANKWYAKVTMKNGVVIKVT